MTDTTADHQFEQILQHLHQTRGFDFTAYKRNSLMRRVAKRMQSVGIESFDAYLDYLQVHQHEFSALFNTILINVTSFYRDPEVWTMDAGARRAAPAHRGTRPQPRPSRVERWMRIGPGTVHRGDDSRRGARSRIRA